MLESFAYAMYHAVADVREAEQAIPRLRTAAHPILQAARADHPHLHWAMTGRGALTYDLNAFNALDTTRAEVRALPLTLLILIFAFGSLAAAGLPLILALVSTIVMRRQVSLVAQSVILSNLVQNVASMIGMAVDIDYSLFVIHRYRREMQRLPAAQTQTAAERTRQQRAVLEVTMASAGSAVFFSGATVLVGMCGLLATPLLETRSLGFGRCVVVSIAVAGTLTLLPALLFLLGPNRLEWPAALSRRLQTQRARDRWGKWADAQTRSCAARWLGRVSVSPCYSCSRGPAWKPGSAFRKDRSFPPNWSSIGEWNCCVS